MVEGNENSFADDAPLTDAGLDRLNRAPFARRVAGILRELPAKKGLVLGIHGPWGDGKTTVLNFVRNALEDDAEIVVRDFNPWRLADDDAMLRGFFSMVAQAIEASLSTKKERFTEGAATWAKRARWVTGLLGLFSKSADTLDGLLARLADVAATGDSLKLEELRSRLAKRLEGSSKRIVVLVDDLDRLDRDETHTLFRLVKACADLPNVCFVLAFDDDAVAAALGERYGAGGGKSGRDFLEKIIQVPLRLPVAAKDDLRSLCFEQVDAALSGAGVELTEQEVGEFVSGFDSGASIRLTTPRAANRYGNALRFALPALIGEVNLADLLLVEALRAFYPDVYAVVRDNHCDFSGVEGEAFGRRVESPRAVRLLEPVLTRLTQDEVDAVKGLLVSLFPRLAGAYGNTNYRSDWIERWSRERRVSSPQYAARYFTYGVPHDDVSDAELGVMIGIAARGSVPELRTAISSHLDGRTASRLIEKLRGIESSVDPATAASLVQAIGPLGAHIPNPRSLMGFETPTGQAGILISHLLRRIPDRARRLEVAKQAMADADPLSFGVECLRWFRVTDKPEKEDANALTQAEEAEAQRVLVDRIKAEAAKGTVLFDSAMGEAGSLLYAWWRADGTEPVQAYLVGMFEKRPELVGAFLEAMAPRAWSAGDVIPHISDLDGGHLKNIRHVIDLDVLADHIRANCAGDFDATDWSYDDTRPVQQRLAEQFTYILRKWETDGEPGADGDSTGPEEPALEDGESS